MTQETQPEKINPETLNRNLLSQVPKKRFQISPAVVKSFALDLVSLVSVFVMGLFFRKFLAGEGNLYLTVIAAAVFIAISSLNTLLKKDFIHRSVVVVLEALVFSVMFWGLPFWVLLSTFLVVLIMSLWGAVSGRAEMENSLEVKFFRVTQKPLSRTITALSIVAILLYVPKWQDKADFISEKAFDSMFSTSKNVAGRLYPEFNFNSDMNALAESLAQTKLNENSQYQLLPPAVKAEVAKKTSSEVVKSLGENLGLQLTGTEDIATVLYKYILRLLESWRTKLGGAFLVLWGITVFLFIRGIGTFVGYFVAFFAYVIYHILLSADFIKIESELQAKEVVDFK
jgi:hypothetical protein